MIDERQEELASLYALDLLEGAERAQFEAEVARDPKLEALVHDLRESSSLLVHTVGSVTPPPELKNRVLRSIETRAARAAAPDEENIIRPPFGFWQFVPWAAAACLALTAGWLAHRESLSRSETSQLQQQQALAAIDLQTTRNQLEAERLINQRRISDLGRQVASLTEEMKTQGDIANLKITTLASMLDNSPQAQAVAVWDPVKQNGLLEVQKLAALASDQDYQLWVVDEANPTRPVDAGVIAFDSSTGKARVKFAPKDSVKAVAAFAISRERKGGVPQREGPIVLLGK